MDIDSLLDIMTRQVQEVEAQLEAQKNRSENTEGTSSLLHSLRVSLRTFSSGVDPDDEASTSFVLDVEEDRQFLLRWDSHRVHLCDTYFQSLLGNAGIVLVPGQSLLLDPGFAKRLIEECLGETASEQRRQEKRRGELLSALKQSAGPWRDDLLKELGRLDKHDADLLIRNLEFAELHVAARDWIGERNPITR